MTKIPGWTLYSEPAPTALLASIMPAQGVHVLAGHDAATDAALAADLAVALAAGDVGCGLGLPDANGVRATLSGFFGQRCGEPVGVAILASNRTAMERTVEAAAKARGTAASLPIAIAQTDGDLQTLINGTCAVHRVRDGLPRALRLVIIEAGASATSARRAAVRGAALAAESVGGCAVLVVTQCGPAGLADVGGVVMEATADSLALAQAPEGVAGWTRAFKTQRILLAGGGEALAIQPGAVQPHKPRWKAIPPFVASAPVVKPEPEITERYVSFVTGRNLGPDELAPWTGFHVVRDEHDALPAAEDADEGGVREIILVPNTRDATGREADIRRLRLEQEAKTRGVDGRVVIRVSERRVAA